MEATAEWRASHLGGWRGEEEKRKERKREEVERKSGWGEEESRAG